MQSPDFTMRRFGADPAESRRVLVQKTHQIFSIIFGVLLFFAAAFFDNLMEDPKFYDEKDLFSMLKIICIFLGIIEVVLSPIILYSVSKQESKLAQTYITITGAGVEGVHFNNPTTGMHFSLPYSDIISATYMSSLREIRANQGNNICIQAKSGTYSCFFIEQKETVVSLINEMKEKSTIPPLSTLNTHVYTPVTPTNTFVSGNEKNYCMYCGVELPSDATFCCKCGKEQKRV